MTQLTHLPAYMIDPSKVFRVNADTPASRGLYEDHVQPIARACVPGLYEALRQAGATRA